MQLTSSSSFYIANSAVLNFTTATGHFTGSGSLYLINDTNSDTRTITNTIDTGTSNLYTVADDDWSHSKNFLAKQTITLTVNQAA